MGQPIVAPYGAWESPITAEMLAAEGIRLSDVVVDGGDIYWLEGRPAEGGRSVLVRREADGATADVTPPPWNVRTTAHEYGGGSYLVYRRQVWFCNFSDQRVYHKAAGGAPRPLTPPGPFRYADLVMDGMRGRLICVRESHQGGGEAVNELVAVRLSDGAVQVLAGGHDFYSSPALSPDGRRLAWLSWDHPNMPWDESAVWTAEFGAQGELGRTVCIGAGNGVSMFQPAWSPEGALYVVADPDGWWNLHRWEEGRLRCVCAKEAEFGLPQWVFGMRTYGFDSQGNILSAYCHDGAWGLGRIRPDTGRFEALALEAVQISSMAVAGRSVALVAGSRQRPAAVILFDADTGREQVLRESTTLEVSNEFLSMPEPVEFPTGGGQTAHGFFYAPRNGAYAAPEGSLPPLLVIGHGGPTGATSAALELKTQFWTSRGFAVLDVNYRGSTGYGRRYRELLIGQWGVADVEDCVYGARYLARAGRVDEARLAIRGSSAGGYTALAALTFHDTFGAGASYYGIGDLEALARETHKFESRYLERLVGPYPERRDLYRARSPIHFVERLACPVIFFQGLEDKIVPPNQAELMVNALRAKGLPVAYLAFEGEQHGFRKAETIKRCLEAELYFYGRVFGFTPAGAIEPVEIENL